MPDQPMRIPYDSLTLCAVVGELQAFVGAKVQRIHQPDPFTLGVGLYSGSAGAGMLLLSCHPQFARAYLTMKRPANQAQPPTFCATLRARVEGGTVQSVRQIEFDRILELAIEHPTGRYRLIAELMGKHSNLILVDGDKKTIAAAKWVSRAKSARPIQSGGKYHPPPFPPRAPLFRAQSDDDLRGFTGASPFLLDLIARDPSAFDRMKACALAGECHPVLVPGSGAYPISVGDPGELPRPSISIALDQHYAAAIPRYQAEALRASLRSQIQRVILAREVALADLVLARDVGRRARELQQKGELILAFGGQLQEGARLLEATDYEGAPITIRLDPELDFKANAQTFFEKARHAKERIGMVGDQIERLSQDRTDLQYLAAEIEAADGLDRLEGLKAEALRRHWLHVQAPPTRRREERPFEGRRVREVVGPGGWPVFYGENAEANDYLVQRLAKPNDWWLHVRGNVSAHVVISTRNHPEKVPMEVLRYAAEIAARHSGLKHSSYVPVDYTLKKYVRKPRSAPSGTATYTHEKTIHVEGLIG